MDEVRKFILETYRNRFTCKGYDKDRKVSDEDFNLLMEVARLSPSSMGFEPWKFLLIEREDIKDKLRPYSWGAIRSFDGASHVVIILARKAFDMQYDSDYIKYIIKDVQHFPEHLMLERINKYKDFQEHDFNLLETKRALFDWTCKQTYIPLANMLTAAAMLGIDSTPIEGFHREKVENVLLEEKLFDPKHFGVSCMIAFGYCNKEPRPKTRRKMEEVFAVIK